MTPGEGANIAWDVLGQAERTLMLTLILRQIATNSLTSGEVPSV